MECRKIQEMFTTYLDGIASPEERRLIEGHIPSCQGCSNALEELKRTAEVIRGLEEVEPPPWLRQKVMARVRTEGIKKSLFRKLFYPLHIKVPIEGFATVLIAVVAIIVFKVVEPEIKKAPLINQEVTTKDEISKGTPHESLKAGGEALAPGRELPARGRSQGERMRLGAGSSAPGHETLEQRRVRPSEGGEASIEGIREEGRGGKETSAGTVKEFPKQEQKATFSKGPSPAVAPRQKDEIAAGRKMEKDMEHETSFGAPAGLRVPGRKRTEAMSVTIHAKNAGTAVKEIENLLVRLGAIRIRRESAETAEVITAELHAERLKDLLEELKGLGKVKENNSATDIGKGDDVIRIEIIGE